LTLEDEAVLRVHSWLPLLSLLSCAPHWADRAGLSDDGGAAAADTSRGPASIDPPAAADAGPTPAAMDARGPADVAGDRRPPPEGPPAETAISADAAAPPDAAAREAPAVRTAMLVVGDALAPTSGDGQILLLLAAAGLRVQLVTDSAPASVAGIDLVVLAASCLAASLGTRYRDLPLPIISMEPAVFDDLGMTGPVSGLDWSETPGTRVAIVGPSHPIASGLAGLVDVVSEPATLTWGRPGPAAQLVATFEGIPDRAAIFGYPPRAPMVVGHAPATRIGFFAADLAAARLTEAGTALLGAAIRWSLR
jgi:hypothetical protein